MYALFFIAIMTWIAVLVGDQTTNNISVMRSYIAQTKRFDLQLISEGVMQYQLENGVLLSDLNLLSTKSGFEHIRSSVSARIGAASVANLTDTLWTFSRIGVFTLNPEKGEISSSYTALNKCGTGTFFAASSWCGLPTGHWFRFETREKNNFELVSQRNRQQRLMQKFSSYFNATDEFPNKDSMNSPLVAGTSYSLAALAGYSGVSRNCTGNFSWLGVPLDCDDLFDRWGGNTNFTFFSNTHIALISTSSILKNNGTAISIATDLNAT